MNQNQKNAAISVAFLYITHWLFLFAAGYSILREAPTLVLASDFNTFIDWYVVGHALFIILVTIVLTVVDLIRTRETR